MENRGRCLDNIEKLTAGHRNSHMTRGFVDILPNKESSVK